MKRIIALAPAFLLFAACQSSHSPSDGAAADDTASADDTALSDPDSADGPAGDDTEAVAPASGDAGTDPAQSFYADVLPLLEKNCVSCHQTGGIAPFALDSFAAAETWVQAIARVTQDRSMPPWAATSDDSCGTFRDSLALSAAEIATFGAWAENGMELGVQRDVQLAQLPQLQNATPLVTPLFAPVPEHSNEAENDEYRCFPVDSPTEELAFITGYSVNPGTPEIVHHLVAFIVNPDTASEIEGKNNGELMAELDAASPDRDGWPCFGAAGEGVAVTGVPVVWAPGQGVMEFPAGSGAPLSPSDKLVLQMHYNLEDPRSLGKTDQTELQLSLADSVERVGLFVVPDEFLGSYFSGEPDTLEPGKASVKYTWRQTMAQLGVSELPDLQLAGIMPHMHELGHRYQMRVLQGEQDQCAVSVNDWDFHWQRMYFYQQAIALPPESSIEVTCDFDTSSRTQPVLPGWGTQNEMCAAIMYVTAPISAFGG